MIHLVRQVTHCARKYEAVLIGRKLVDFFDFGIGRTPTLELPKRDANLIFR